MNGYSVGVTLWKALWTLAGSTAAGAAAAGVLAIQLPESWEEFVKAWPALAVPLVLAMLRAADNWRKNSGSPWAEWLRTRSWLPGALVLVIMVGSGCTSVTSGYETRTSSTDPETGVVEVMDETMNHTVRSFWAEVQEAAFNQAINVRGDEGYEVLLGSRAVGMDSTGVPIAISQMIQQTVSSAVAGAIQGLPAILEYQESRLSPPGGVGLSDILRELDAASAVGDVGAIRAMVGQLRARLTPGATVP